MQDSSPPKMGDNSTDVIPHCQNDLSPQIAFGTCPFHRKSFGKATELRILIAKCTSIGCYKYITLKICCQPKKDTNIRHYLIGLLYNKQTKLKNIKKYF